jgi:hypothetical protein
MFLPSCSGTDLLKELQMPQANIPAMLLAIALAATCWAELRFALAPVAAGTAATPAVTAPGDPPASARVASWSEGAVATADELRSLLAAAHARAPILVIALAASLVLPVVALVSYFVQSAARRKKDRAASHALAARADLAELTDEEPTDRDASPLWSHQAWLTPQSSGGAALPLAGRVIRIGRHQDNDIHLHDASVHRYHAVIEHTQDEAYVIIDLSGKTGNGVRINGERLARAQLTDGDVIEIGRQRLKFESVPV